MVSINIHQRVFTVKNVLNNYFNRMLLSVNVTRHPSPETRGWKLTKQACGRNDHTGGDRGYIYNTNVTLTKGELAPTTAEFRRQPP